MTWFVKEGGYELFFNRDESILRSHADLPTLQQQRDIAYLSPTDADAGGTWIAVNQFGVTVCLLNHYQFEQIETYKQWTSRGEIVRSFATTESLRGVDQRFSMMELDDYRAFRMFIIDRFGNNRLCVWDGHQARVEEGVDRPKSSSAVDARHVKQVRKDLFTSMGLTSSQDSDKFLAYHASHDPDKSQESVCMHRADANTVSLSHVDVSASGVNFSYADGPPCEATMGEPLFLALQAISETSAADGQQERRIALAATI
ncbi:MAG: NRDE family protein [Pseudomonadota bacterium]